MGKFDDKAKERFLEVLEDSCCVKDAAAAAGVSRTTAYSERKQDLGFAQEWGAAVQRALDDLLGEAHRRATKEKSDRLLEVLLKFRYGDQMADRLAVKVEQSTGLDPATLLAMPHEDREQLRALLSKYADAERSNVLEHDNAQR
ncbi:hypothetical protein [Lysobacter sp. 22409]|uniref:hypothetical protein n=1 Tax=Lysobacter sp. 22409 TaxID=3453917 RepID=UPI003F866EC1